MNEEETQEGNKIGGRKCRDLWNWTSKNPWGYQGKHSMKFGARSVVLGGGLPPPYHIISTPYIVC